MITPQAVTQANSTAGRAVGNQIHFICTTEAELPSGAVVIDKDTAYCQDTGNPFTRTGGAWVLDVQIPVVAVRLLETGGPTSLLIGNVANGQHLIRVGSTIVGSPDMILVSKTTTETIASSAVLHDDTALHFPMLANKTYRFELVAFWDTAAAADFKFRTSGPAAPTSVRVARHTIVPATTAYGNVAVDMAYSAADVICLSAASNGGYVRLDGIITNGSNLGDFRFRWSQNTSVAGNTSVLAGSHIAYRQID